MFSPSPCLLFILPYPNLLTLLTFPFCCCDENQSLQSQFEEERVYLTYTYIKAETKAETM